MNSRKKRKLNTKKGISLVVAIALSAVLVLTTTSFISLALLQQKETGTELNTRQAYVSAKSALDMAKEMIEKGELSLAGSGPFYYVLYYNGTGVGVQTCSSAADAKTFIETTSYSVVGNSYIKITKDGTNCTVSAFSSESKYTADPDDASHGDLSMKFEATEIIPAVGTLTTLKINEGSVSTITPPGPTSSGNRFLLVGGQTNFSLLKSAYKQLNNDNADRLQLLAQYHMSDNNVVFTPSVETQTYPVATQFPLIYTEVVKNNTNDHRATYKVYDDGIYFLGCYNGSEIGPGNQYTGSNNHDASYYSNNNAYGSILHCKFIVIENNMLAKIDPNDANKNCAIEVRPYGTGDLSGVVVYLPNGSTFARYNTNGDEIDSVTYSPGYYWLPCQANSGKVDLLAPNNGMTSISNTDSRCSQFNSRNIYNTLKDSNGNFKEMHSAWESVSDTGSEPVNILGSNGKFTKDSKTYSSSARSSYYDKWDDYSIYCGPFQTPEATGYYDMYCGETFNYLWYNVYDMNVKDNVKMSIRSSNTVLTIGGDESFAEKAIKTSLPWGDIMRTYMPGENPPSNESVNAGPLTASRNIIGTGSAEFWIRPYLNETSFTLNVMNDFHVKYPGGEYEIKAGEYDDIYSTPGFTNGINLFSNDAKNYFENKTSGGGVTVISSDDSSIGWVNSNTIANLSSSDSRLTQTGKYVNFKATSGNLVTSAVYSAEAIDCDFSHTVETNGATLKAKLLSIDASKIKGDTLYINTKEGSGSASNKSHCIVKNPTGTSTTYDTGHLLELKQDMELCDSTGHVWRTLKRGYYFFATSSNSVNILSKSTWTSGAMSIYYAENAGIETDYGYEYGDDVPVTNVNFNQGGYY